VHHLLTIKVQNCG